MHLEKLMARAGFKGSLSSFKEKITDGLESDASVAEAAGLVSILPPPSARVVANGPRGGLRGALCIVESLQETGINIPIAANALEFGCGDGRVLRYSTALIAHANWYACDVQSKPLSFVKHAFPSVVASRSKVRPPLQYKNGMFDFIYALSIWSHFGKEHARIWLEEMARITKPGGVLWMSTHGPDLAERYVNNLPTRVKLSQTQIDKIVSLLSKENFAYLDYYNELNLPAKKLAVDQEYGFTFISERWFVDFSKWNMIAYMPLRLSNLQDVYIFRRV